MDAPRDAAPEMDEVLPSSTTRQHALLTGLEAQPRWLSLVRLLPGIAAIVFLVVGLQYGAASFLNTAVSVFLYSPKSSIGPELSQYVSKVRQTIPPGAPILYVGAEPEYWFSRLWQRAFYPNSVFVMLGPEGLRSPAFHAVRTRHRIRYAVSAGAPPLDPGYKWHASWPALPATTGEVWFGELRP